MEMLNIDKKAYIYNSVMETKLTNSKKYLNSLFYIEENTFISKIGIITYYKKNYNNRKRIDITIF